ncbi:ankyrin repeat-containing domain protein [Russula emetica]|nr:ankyrin repeat-containing domain protein [Russula emetica]
MLLEHHADIHSRNARGEVALHLVACAIDGDDDDYDPNILQLLLDHGADGNTKDNEGSTPLHHSSFRNEDDVSSSGGGTVEGTRLLLEHGANIDAENNKGDTPFLVALEAGHHEMAEFLWGLGTISCCTERCEHAHNNNDFLLDAICVAPLLELKRHHVLCHNIPAVVSNDARSLSPTERRNLSSNETAQRCQACHIS